MDEMDLTMPEMTPLQALVVSILFEGELPSREIREELALRGLAREASVVYRMLGRMELAHYLCGRYRLWRMPDGRTIRERHYRVSEVGFDQWKATIGFYQALEVPPEGFRPVPMGECWQGAQDRRCSSWLGPAISCTFSPSTPGTRSS